MTDLLDDIDDFVDGDEEDTLIAEESLDVASQKRLYTDRRRRVEDLRDLWRMRDELGLYDSELFN